MLMNAIEDKNKEVLHTLLVSELRSVYNIKYQKDSSKQGKTKNNAKTQKCRVFNVPLQHLQLTDAILVNGGVVQVPHFISDSCQKILDHAETEGIFRKAGSAQRLKDIRTGLENGDPVSRSLNVIDLGDVLKSFFRDLPEPLLAPGACQEMLLRCVLLPQETEQVRALLLTCLLLPQITLNTLAFFMQFLQKIASQCKVNRMTTHNLAIVFTPSLMPLTDTFNSIRLSNHLKVIEILIEHSMDIGVLPQSIFDHLSVQLAMPAKGEKAAGKRKKRRSSSMTRFCVNGLKKIVNNVRRDSVDNNLNGGSEPAVVPSANDLNYMSQTPLLTAKKRKNVDRTDVADTMRISAKKKRDILPELLSTPLIFKEKKRRPSLISHFRPKSVVASQPILQDDFATSSLISLTTAETSSPPPPLLPRRWSDATGTPHAKVVKQQQQSQFMSPVVSMPCLTLQQSLEELNDLRIPSMDLSTNDSEGDYVRIPKREYEAIKSRVFAIEKRISREFDLVQTQKHIDAGGHGVIQSEIIPINSPSPSQNWPIDHVQNEYQRALEETEELNRGGTEELAKRLGRDLKIRRSAEHKIIRSPSARKIGSLRRRSRVLDTATMTKLNRTKSLNIQASERGDENEDLASFNPRGNSSNLRRGRPNTIQTGLKVHRSPPGGRPSVGEKSKRIPSLNEFYPAATAMLEEEWTDALDFFASEKRWNRKPHLITLPVTPKRTEANERRASLRSAGRTPVMDDTPTKPANLSVNFLKTPMLPPSSKQRGTKTKQTPAVMSNEQQHYNPNHLTPLQAQQTGRASIARIRSQNAGMVLAKARLFNDLGGSEELSTMTRNSLERNGCLILDAQRAERQKNNRAVSPTTYVSSASFRKPHIHPILLAKSPRRIVKTPSRDRAIPVRALPRSPLPTRRF